MCPDNRYIYMYVCMCVRVYVCTCVRVYVCTCVRVYVCMYMYICIYIYIYVCMYIYRYLCKSTQGRNSNLHPGTRWLEINISVEIKQGTKMPVCTQVEIGIKECLSSDQA